MRIDRKRRAWDALFHQLTDNTEGSKALLRDIVNTAGNANTPDDDESLIECIQDISEAEQGSDRETRILDMPEIDMMGFFKWRD